MLPLCTLNAHNRGDNVSRGQPIKTLERAVRLLEILREAKQIHIRGIARVLGINPYTASKLVENYFKPFVDVNYVDEFGIRVKIIRLKPEKENITITDILRYMELKKRIKGTEK